MVLLSVPRRSAVVIALVLQSSISVNAFWNAQTDEEKTESTGTPPNHDPVEYGVDVSFPMHYGTVSDNYPWLPHNVDPEHNPVPEKYKDMVLQPLGDRQKFYKEFMDGCRAKFGKKGNRCEQNERDRVAMSLRQPQSMQNYTDVGFKKIRAPEKVFALLKDFWEKNKDKETPESWGAGNTYTNNWVAPSSMVSVEDRALRGGGAALKQQIWNAARDTIQAWTGEELTECSLYGIRVYKEGSVLSTHVDRLPLVSSAIINVAQDVDEPWPLEVYGHDGKATNVTMVPGDMVLYESHSVLHGRPFPLKGRYMANVFIHFEPTGHSLRHNARIAKEKENVHEKYRKATERGVSGHEAEQEGMPSYIMPGSPEADNWKRSHPNGKRSRQNSFTTGSTSAHQAAQKGDLDKLKTFIDKDKSLLAAQDENGWQPIHEASRGGHAHVVRFLHEQGADVNARTGEDGGTPLWWAQQVHDSKHPVVRYLVAVGALSLGPEL